MKKEKIKLFRDLILARPLPAPEKTAGGIIIPNEAKDDSRYLEVLEIGSGIHGIEPGDTIVTVGEHPGGQDFTFNGEDLVIMRDKYVFGVVEK